MAEPIARIRAYEDDDNKQVRFVIGKSNLESLAVLRIDEVSVRPLLTIPFL